jgi:short-subunit dehydrogenase
VELILEKSSSVSNPLAVITGASAGIGATYAKSLVEIGYDVLLVARREEKLRAVQAEIGADRAEIFVADLATDAGLDAVTERIRSAENLDFLVNNAGFGTMGLFWEADLESQEKMHRLHVLATMRLTHAALGRMIRRDRGFIVNVSSVAGFGANVGSVSYCSTKAWMNNFTDGLWQELKYSKSGVRAQALCPGFTRSEFHEAVGMDVSGIPESLWTSAQEVVDASMDGLARNELYVVPGWRYQTWVAMQKALPREILYAITTRSKDKFKKPKDA